MTIASFLGIVAALLVRFAFYSELFGGGGRDRRPRRQRPERRADCADRPGRRDDHLRDQLPADPAAVALPRAIGGPVRRAADRPPSKLASALVKVTGEMARIPTRDLRTAEPLNAFYFTPALANRPGQFSLNSIFSTHPPLEKRLKQLDEIAQQLGR